MSRECQLVVGMLFALALILSLGCRAKPSSSVQPVDGWQQIALPGHSAVSSLARFGAAVLVSGQDGTGEAPLLWQVAQGEASPITLKPTTPYAEVADLVSVAGDGDRIVALGAAQGGAHGNFRWTPWSGTVDGVGDVEQTFETFGGQQAGGLLGVAMTTEGPVIAGSWASRGGGLDGAVWLPEGDRWVREPSDDTALANGPDGLVAQRGVVAQDGGVLLMGSVITFPDGLKQTAAVWARRGQAETWTQTELPDGGERSESLSADCGSDVCWVAGYVDGSVALWTVADRSGQPEAARVSGLPGVDASDEPRPRVSAVRGQAVVVVDSTVVIVPAEKQPGRSGAGAEWRAYTGPTGRLIDAVTVGDELFVAVAVGDSSQLWHRGLTDLVP